MSEFARNKHGQLVYIPTVERMALDHNVSIVTMARIIADNVYRDGERMILPMPINPGFQYPELRNQDLSAPLKYDLNRFTRSTDDV